MKAKVTGKLKEVHTEQVMEMVIAEKIQNHMDSLSKKTMHQVSLWL